MKVSKIIKGAVLATFGVLIIAGGVFAIDYSQCTGPGKKFPNLAYSTDGNNPDPTNYGVTCPSVKDSSSTDGGYITFYAKSSSDCASAATLASDPDGCSGSDMNGMIRTVINAIVFIVGMVAVVMIILGGVNYATSQGDPGKVKKGKDTILYGIIGLVIAILAFAIVNFVLGALQQ